MLCMSQTYSNPKVPSDMEHSCYIHMPAPVTNDESIGDRVEMMSIKLEQHDISLDCTYIDESAQDRLCVNRTQEIV